MKSQIVGIPLPTTSPNDIINHTLAGKSQILFFLNKGLLWFTNKTDQCPELLPWPLGFSHASTFACVPNDQFLLALVIIHEQTAHITAKQFLGCGFTQSFSSMSVNHSSLKAWLYLILVFISGGTSVLATGVPASPFIVLIIQNSMYK